MTREQVIERVMAELNKAEEKHPIWPEGRLRQVVIIAEESGEALQAALTIIESEEAMARTELSGYDITLAYNRMAGLEEKLEEEVAQTAAMAIRWLLNRKPLYAQA